MKKSILFFMLFISVVEPCKSQGTGGSDTYLMDLKGSPFGGSKYSDIIGSPFFNDTWTTTTIKFLNNKVIQSQCKVNLYTHEVHYLNQVKEEWIFPKEVVKEVEFYINGELFRFKTANKLGDEKTKSLYQVLVDGNVSLQLLIDKKIQETKDFNSAVGEKRFKETKSLVLNRNNKLTRVKRDKDFILSILEDKRSELEVYIKNENIKFKNDQDLIKVITYFNSL